MTQPPVLDLRGTVPGADDLAPAVAHVRGGGVLAYPTETVYGFGGLCTTGAVARVRALKRRAEDRPLLALIRGMEDAEELVWTEPARDLAAIFWPGAVTLVLSDPERIFPDGVRTPEGTVAVRVSPHPLVASLLDLLGAPLTSTSANAPGAAPALSGTEALAAIRALGGGEEVMVLDVGALPASGPSTVIDCTGPAPVVLREGTVPVSRLRCAVPEIHER